MTNKHIIDKKLIISKKNLMVRSICAPNRGKLSEEPNNKIQNFV